MIGKFILSNSTADRTQIDLYSKAATDCFDTLTKKYEIEKKKEGKNENKTDIQQTGF